MVVYKINETLILLNTFFTKKLSFTQLDRLYRKYKFNIAKTVKDEYADKLTAPKLISWNDKLPKIVTK